MPKRARKLKVKQVEAIREPGLYAVGGVPGLHLQISEGSGRSWTYRYQIAGRRRDMGLGSIDIYSLADARERAREARKLIDQGIDPIDKRKAEKRAMMIDAAKAMTFQQCAKAYIEAHQAGWRNAKHGAQWTATLETYAYPVFGRLLVAAVDVGLVMKVLEPIWSTKPETASRVRGRIESVLDWATVRGYRTGENPARWRGHLESLLPPPSKAKRAARVATGREEHHAALPYGELAAFMAALRAQDGTAARALEWAILTAARTGEVIGARWHEIDIDNRLWTVPAARMKAGKEHRVPLSDAALAILEKMPHAGDYVFPGAAADRPLSNMAMNMMLRRMKRDAVTVHGFRSAFADWCAERTAYPAEVREMALAHTVSDKVEAAYRRGDLFEKRRKVMEDWAKFCAAPPSRGDNVTPLRQRSDAANA